jgi:cytochrome P450
MNAATNEATADRVMLCTDGNKHRDMRRVFIRPLVPAAVATLRERLKELAEARLDELVGKGRFDGVGELAHFLPLTVVTELVGFNEEGKRQMLRWAAGMFNSMGPEGNARTLDGLAITGEMFEYIATRAPRSSLDPGGWGAALFAAADRGELAQQDAQAMLMDYLGPALDTTIHGTSAALWLFARHPAQWEKLRADPALIPGAINEVLRLESPIRAFTRYATRDADVGGTLVPGGSRVLMLYACANRDGRRYADPEAFDITRNPTDHLAFGHGAHMCAGMHLAKLEIGLLLEGLARRVAGFEVHGEQRAVHNTLRGLASLDLSVRAA